VSAVSGLAGIGCAKGGAAKASEGANVMSEVFSPLDLGLLVIALVSGLAAMFRGLTREVLSLVSWALAGGAGLWFMLYQKSLAASLAEQFSVQPIVAQAIGAALLALLVLIIAHIVTSKFSDQVLDSQIGFIDRVFGFLFGVLRGYLLVVILFVFAGFLLDATKSPWVKNAQSLPLIKLAADPLSSSMRGIGDYIDSHFGNKNGAPAQPTDEAQGQSG
jgi:membrane protein required for colicin V production